MKMSSPAPDAHRPPALHQARADNDVNTRRRETHPTSRSDSDGDGRLCGPHESTSERKKTEELQSLASEWDEVRTDEVLGDFSVVSHLSINLVSRVSP